MLYNIDKMNDGEKFKKALMQQQIYFINEPPVNYQLKQKTVLRNWICKTIQAEKKHLIQLNYIFCNDDFLLQLNKKHLNHNYFTDILTFDNSDTKKAVEGDIFISIDRVRDNAKTLKTLLREELNRVVIHGVLHLCGYKDKTSLERQKMRSKEDFYLNELNK